MAIDPRAVIDPSAKLADGVEVGAFTVIGANVEIGPGCWIGPHAVIQGPTRIGARNRIFQFASLGDAPQDKKYKGEPTRLEIGDDNVFREFVTVNRGTTHDEGITRIGSDNLFMAYSHVAHDCIIRKNAVIANAVNIAGHVHIDEHAVIGGVVAIHQFSRIGKHSMVAGGCMIRKDVPPYVLAGRDPISYVGVNHRGLKRRGFSSESIREIQEIYRSIFLSSNNISQALEIVEEKFPDSTERDEILNFIRSSERGIMRGYNFM